MRVATVTLQEVKDSCEQALRKQRNRTTERYKLFTRKQKKKALRKLWYTLTGLATKQEFGDQTAGLLMEAVIQNMNNNPEEERLCREPKDYQQEAFRVALLTVPNVR